VVGLKITWDDFYDNPGGAPMTHEQRLRKFYPSLGPELDRLKALRLPASFDPAEWTEEGDK
jgi:hypothetical protein